MQRVRIEPERTGWARISDLLRQNDEMAVQDVKEDIDSLLVFVGLLSLSFFMKSTYIYLPTISFLKIGRFILCCAHSILG